MPATRLAAVLLATSLPFSMAAAQDPGIHGLWWTKGKKGRVEIADCAPPSKGICGKIVWISQPNDAKGQPQTDKNNRNASLRSRPIIDLQLFEGWRENGPKKWRGSIYDPDDGKNYNVGISLAGDKLVITGCIEWGCESETWTRYREP
jgi:uncharacterized protein (DUF2147 family)